LLRSDLSVSVPAWVALLDHNGLSQRRSPKYRTHLVGGRHSFYVVNGTSTANKDHLAWPFVSRGRVVLVDRNCHKSILHAIIMTGAYPCTLTGSAQ